MECGELSPLSAGDSSPSRPLSLVKHASRSLVKHTSRWARLWWTDESAHRPKR